MPSTDTLSRMIGTGNEGSDNGATGQLSEAGQLTSIAINPVNNDVYFGDGNHTIRKAVVESFTENLGALNTITDTSTNSTLVYSISGLWGDAMDYTEDPWRIVDSLNNYAPVDFPT